MKNQSVCMYIFFVMFISSNVLASKARCNAIVEVLGEKRYSVPISLKDGNRHHFNIVNTNFRCTLVFYKNYGSMVSCSFGESGDFVQSDRSGIKENNSQNNLSFNHLGKQVYIKTKCNQN